MASEHRASIEWRRAGRDFAYETYDRAHLWRFEGGPSVAATAARANVPPGAPGTPGVDPEQAFVAAISSCHMLWFLHLACNDRLVVERYTDDALGVLAKNAEGREAMTRVTLRPVVSFSGAAPTPEKHAALHERAHRRCYIANSVKAEIVLEPRIAPHG